MKKLAKVGGWLLLAGLLPSAGFLWFVSAGAGPDRSERMEKVRGEFAAKKVKGSNWVAPPSSRPKVVARARNLRSKIVDPGDGDELTEEEEKLVDAIHDALNDEDLELAIELAKRAAKSKKAEVRGEMVDTLRWFGGEAMPELLMFVADPDEGVRMDAMSAYQQAIYDIENDEDKAKVVEISLRNLDDADALEEIASELIGMDDLLAVQTLVNVIDGGGCETGRRVAKGIYESVTGEEFTTLEAAEAWLREQQAD